YICVSLFIYSLILSASSFSFYSYHSHLFLRSFPTRRSSDLFLSRSWARPNNLRKFERDRASLPELPQAMSSAVLRFGRFSSFGRSEEHTSELQSPDHLVCRLLLEKKKTIYNHKQARSLYDVR